MTQDAKPNKSIDWAEIFSYLTIILAIALNTSLTISWIAIIVLLLLALVKHGPVAAFKQAWRAPFMVPILVFVLISFVSGLAAGGLKEGLSSLTTARGFVIYPVLYLVLDNQKVIARGFYGWLIAGAICGVMGLIEGVFNYHPFTTYQYLQATGFLNNPMTYAGIMQLTSFMAAGHLAALFVNRKSTSINTLALPLVLLCANFVGLLFAAERSAWLGMVAGVLVLTLRISRKAFLLGILVLSFSVVAGYFAVPVVKTRLQSASNWQADQSITLRLKVWQIALDTFKTSPLLGAGPRNFPRIPTDAVPGESKDLNHGHSNYMHVLATLGVLGLISFAWLVVAPFIATWRAAQEPGWPDGINLGLMAALASLMVAGIFEYNFGSGQVRLAEWFCLAFYRPRK
ncbi:MAG: O-antigen ligase family protein [Candidatus Obscuribacter sp.]|nr:O-antigen ligase family protein [Candidatus Obscuribacter sp.]